MSRRAGPANLFQVLMLDGLQARRALALRLGGSVLIGLPLLVLPMSASMRAAGVSLLVVFAGLFGGVVGTARLRGEGLWERLQLLPLGRYRVSADRVLAESLLDSVQVGPLVLGVLALHGRWSALPELPGVLGLLAATLIVLNLLGMGLASRLGSNAEAHLWGGLSVAVVALFSGLFPVSGRIEGLVVLTAPLLPPHHLLGALRESMGGGPAPYSNAVGVLLLVLFFAAVLGRALDLSASGTRSVRSVRANDGRM